MATLEWVAWFNNRRLLEPIGYVPPAQYEAVYYATPWRRSKPTSASPRKVTLLTPCHTRASDRFGCGRRSALAAISGELGRNAYLGRCRT